VLTFVKKEICLLQLLYRETSSILFLTFALAIAFEFSPVV